MTGASRPLEPYGILNLDKPSGPTSHDMVALVRRELGTRQVGHAGTLDPLATGVLVMGVGPATRLMSFVGDGSKEYVTRLLLGRATDTEDITGQTLRETSAKAVTRERLEEAARGLTGPIMQTPPMVSAVKYQGRRLYEIARQGETVDRKPRSVTVYSLQVLDFRPGEQAQATLQIRCSGGLYVRTICADLGSALECGGCMAALRRTAVGPFTVEYAVTPETLSRLKREALLPAASAVVHYPAVVIAADQERRVRNGGWLELPRSDEAPSGTSVEPRGESRAVRLEDRDGRLVAMATRLDIEEGRVRYQPFLVLAAGAGDQGSGIKDARTGTAT